MEECFKAAVYLAAAAEHGMLGSSDAEMREAAARRFVESARRYAVLQAIELGMGPTEAKTLLDAWKVYFPMAMQTVGTVERPVDPAAFNESVDNAVEIWPQKCASDELQFSADQLARTDEWMKDKNFTE